MKICHYIPVCDSKDWCIKKLILDYDSDSEIVDDILVLQELRKFYRNPYSRRSVKTQEQCLTYLENINTPKLLENETLHFSTRMNSQSSTWKMTTQIKLDIT